MPFPATLLRILIALGTASLLAGATAPLPELDLRQQIAQEVASKFLQRDFASLEKMAADYREHESRTPSGLWNLTVFYASVVTLANVDPTNEVMWNSLNDAGIQWVRQFPESPTSSLAYARLLLARAWKIRGGAYASQVQADRWAPFKAQLDGARRVLELHKDVASADPEWYRSMLEIAYSEGWDFARYSELLDEAIARYPYYYEIYFEALVYLFPKWHGSARDVDAFIRLAVENTRPREGDGMYARIYWTASQWNYGEKLFADSQVSWSRMRGAIDDVLKKYPDQWNIANFAHFACLARDRDKTASLLRRMSGPVIADAWDGNPDNYRRCAAWAASNAPYPFAGAPGPGA
jgi:hypothetical protein